VHEVGRDRDEEGSAEEQGEQNLSGMSFFSG